MTGRMSCHDVSFDDETMRAMGEAFDQVCDALGNSGAGVKVREIIARRIVEAAIIGERDPSRLCLQAQNALGIDEKSTIQLAA